MSDYDPRYPESPFQRDTPNVRWGWVAAVVCVAVVLAVVFGMWHQPSWFRVP
jgi:hypothetical protein